MTCGSFQALMPDLLLGSAAAPAVTDPLIPADAARHLEECEQCKRDWSEMRATLKLLDEWHAPEPSAYFSTRLAARLREEKQSPAPGWFGRMRTHLGFGGGLRLRPIAAGALGIVFVLAGFGSYEGFEAFHQTQPTQQAVSATVQDLELLDANAQTLQELAAFDESDGPPAPDHGVSY